MGTVSGSIEDRSGTARRREWLIAAGTFLGLSVLLHLPELLLGPLPGTADALPDGLTAFGSSLFSLDLFVLFSLIAGVPPKRVRGRTLGRIVGAAIVGLLLYEGYAAVVDAMLHRPPNVYADAYHLVGAAYLVVNGAVPAWHVAGLVGLVGVSAGLGVVLPGLLSRVHRILAEPRARRFVLGANVVVWTFVFGAVSISSDSTGDAPSASSEIPTAREGCRSTTTCLVRNVRRAFALRSEIARRKAAPVDSTYVRYLDRRLGDSPPIYLVVLESYGTVLAESPRIESPYGRLMARTVDSLREDGWLMVTGRSEAPVFGGLSWLSVASLLLGTPVEHEPVFQMLRPQLVRYPHLVRILEEHGYETATLQPPVRARPGLTVGNPYGFDRTFYLEDLAYTGPPEGWGIVPDQYSLAVAHERFVRDREGSFFLFFETVSSHAPWDRRPPPIVETPSDPSAYARSRRDTGRERSYGGDGDSIEERLLVHIAYQWRVLRDYIREYAPAESLFLVVGDHQPHFARRGGRTTPVHLITRNADVAREFQTRDFVAGGRPPHIPTEITHAGLLSLLMRSLIAPTAVDSAADLPETHPRGVRRSAILSVDR